jgi:hypothetical protein
VNRYKAYGYDRRHCDAKELGSGQDVCYRFFGAYVNSKTKDLACAHFEPVEQTEIEMGFLFELWGTVLDNEKGKAMVEIEWQNDSQSKQRRDLRMHYLQYSGEDIGPLESKHRSRGVIPEPAIERYAY